LNGRPRLSSIPTVDARREAAEATRQDARDKAIHREEIVVPDDVIDGNGHVNNVAYVQWMQDVAVRHFAAVGGVEPMRAVGGTWVARSHRIEYLRPAFAGDRIEVRTWVADCRRVRSLRRYEFVRPSDGAVLARGETDWVFVRAEDGRPRAIPETIRRAFTVVPDGEERV
jgi:acyl-CoA thioester hydrolase